MIPLPLSLFPSSEPRTAGDLRCQCVFSWSICAIGVRRISRSSVDEVVIKVERVDLPCAVRNDSANRSITVSGFCEKKKKKRQKYIMVSVTVFFFFF